jgi:DNA-binding IclR family transcriptional regulator
MPTSKIVMSIMRAANILDCISRGHNKLSKIADFVGLSKGTTHRLLATLVKAGFIVQDPISLEYNLGPAILQLASDFFTAHGGLLNCALGEMERLKQLTGETVLLHARSGLNRVCIAQIESPHSLRYTNEIGFVAPLYVGGAGKVLLSQLKDEELQILLENINFLPITPETILDKNKLLAEIYKVREEGYATSFGERVQGSSCISVPLRNYIIPIALSILGPITRFKIDEKSDLLHEIQSSSQKISEKLKMFNRKAF